MNGDVRETTERRKKGSDTGHLAAKVWKTERDAKAFRSTEAKGVRRSTSASESTPQTIRRRVLDAKPDTRSLKQPSGSVAVSPTARSAPATEPSRMDGESLMRVVSDAGSGVNATAAAAAASAAKAQAAQKAQAALMEYLHDRFHLLIAFLLIGYGVMFLLSSMLLAYLRLNRRQAFGGNMDAARKVILPAYEPLLAVLAGSTFVYTVFFASALACDMYKYDISKVATEVFYSGRQFVFLSVVVFMLQKSVSGPALRRSLVITLILSTYTIPIVWYMATYGNPSHFYVVLVTSRALLLLLYTYVLVCPPERASKRTLREFCVYAYIYYAFLFAYNECFQQKQLDAGFTLAYINLITGSLCPLVIWRVLKADTEHWRGFGQRAVALQTLFRQKQNVPERVSARGLHVLIEMHRKYIIDFAHLELCERIGLGASAVVFNGVLRSKFPVAVKVYTPTDFTDATIAEFSQEAALCGSLHHPNIVKFYGMCVCPPTVCLVSELCQGSLEEVTQAVVAQPTQQSRQQLLINVAYLLDASRAVAHLHSFIPAFLHRDIKPANFLVDGNGVVKLTDFGESRSLPRGVVSHNTNTGTGFFVDSVSSGGIVATLTEGIGKLGSGAQLQRVRTSEWKDVDASQRMTIKGTIDYMAPELINGRGGQAAYGEAADVYALGVTLWDIMYPGKDKYPDAGGNHLRIYECVSAGHRPMLTDDLHPSLRTLIESAWHSDPRMRPSAHNVVNILESIQDEVAAVFAEHLMDKLKAHKLLNHHHHDDDVAVFEGDRCVELFELNRFVDNEGEGVRVGNALMDAGLLHHAMHSHPFENTQQSYYLEENAIALSQPIDATSSSRPTTGSSNSRSAVHRGRAQSSRRPTSPSAASSKTKHGSEDLLGGLCPCRKLSQRLIEPQKPKRRRPFQRSKERKKAAARNGLANLRAELRNKLMSTSSTEGSDRDDVDDFADFVDDIPRLSDVHEASDDFDDDDGDIYVPGESHVVRVNVQ